MAPEPRPPFPTYLLPSISFPFRRRSSTSSYSQPSLSSSATSSPATTPSSSPPSAHFILPSSPTNAKSVLRAALSKIPEYSGGLGHKLHAERDSEEEDPQGLQRAQPNTLRCLNCASDIALASQVVSKGFTGRHGRAYLVSPPHPPPYRMSNLMKKDGNKKVTDLVNTKVGRNVNRELLTGQHVVADVSCTICGTVLGWKYVDAKEAAQKYKIGKFILEMKRVVVGVGWEDVGADGGEFDEREFGAQADENDEDIVVFDSEDEDECEDLFAGAWDPEVVAKRRARRVGRKKEI
ncbi:yippee-domain-containing protein [Hyaloscypha variabilis F]|uniref:Yippee-domain-containing protein n=1 Tax=Hyaloscypha variabilis (strain UAMH 11265 / GT02V1 / F) TaxID=1149755 RepID=A0A2J6S123_HYAVF|nr:yippee-domain-containing protein [Hyaloscypha variabilis F]